MNGQLTEKKDIVRKSILMRKYGVLFLETPDERIIVSNVVGFSLILEVKGKAICKFQF